MEKRKSKKRIGFLSYWGFGRGQAYLTLAYTKMLIPEYDVYIMKQGTNKIAPEFEVDVKLMEVPNYHVDPSVFETWIKANELDAVVFFEYNQWFDDGNNLIQVAKDCGAKTYGWLVWEKWTKKEDYADYDRLIASTVSFEKFFRKNKIRNFTYLPYSVDLNEFPKPESDEPNEVFTFFHPGGYGGVHERKNTRLVIEAFKALDRDDTKLIISSQKPLTGDFPPNIEVISKDLPRKELIDLYYKADMVVLPSKWESIGLPILEGLAAGKPVIVPNAPPMNEFIRTGMNGYLVTGDMKRYPGIGVFAIETSANAIKNAMINSMNGSLYSILSRNSRYVIEELYDLEKNKKYFLDFLEKDLQ
jgi:glycosyltransferase involved in cell wall biosynthesis